MPDSVHDRFAAAGEFVPYFQPIVDLRSGALAGFELLARQLGPQNEIIGPELFIPLAEREGWINDLTFHLMAAALPLCSTLPGKPFLAFNLSAAQLHDSNLPANIRQIAESLSFSLDRLSFEVTESSVLQDLNKAATVAEHIRSLGCGLGLDDFGTGYSSLATLQALPFNVLKIDRRFVSTMATKKASRKIVAAVIGLGQSLDIKTVAEGIETLNQNEMVEWLGCDFGQGWFHGGPVPAADLGEVVLQPRANKAPERVTPDLDHCRSLSRFDNLPHVRLAQLRSVYDAVPVGLAFVDREERYLNVNRRLAEINGAPMVDHLGKTVAEMIPEMYPQVCPNLFRALRGESILTSIEIGKPHPWSEVKKFLVSYEPARDEGGEIVGVSIAVLDMEAIDARLF